MNILLADDDIDDCVFFKEALEELQIPAHLTIVYNGEQLMKLLVDAKENLPQVLFLDLNMPRKNGFECLSEIKLNPNLQLLPVIIFSTSLEQEVVNLLYKNGAHYFIRKPSEFEQLKRIIHLALALLRKELNANWPGSLPQPTRENFILTVKNTGNLNVSE